MQQLEMLEPAELLRCSACKELKTEDSFYAQTQTKRGRSYNCKECQIIQSRDYYANNAEGYKKLRSKYYKNNIEYFKERDKRQSKDSIKVKAKTAVFGALKKGLLTRQPCEECGAEKTDAHHDDYAKPLEVRWLCRRHHTLWHAEFGEAPNACTVRHWTPTQELKS